MADKRPASRQLMYALHQAHLELGQPDVALDLAEKMFKLTLQESS